MAQKYYDKLKSLIKDTSNGPKVPYYYYLPKESIEYEKQKPGSQFRLPSPEIHNDSSHLYTQAIWFICQLLGNFF